jgi:hypothetical protein
VKAGGFSGFIKKVYMDKDAIFVRFSDMNLQTLSLKLWIIGKNWVLG